MNTRLQVPEGSRIECINTEQGQTLILPYKGPGCCFGTFLFVFLSVWLTGWAIGWAFAFLVIVTGDGDLGVCLWFLGWTVGGFFASRIYWLTFFARKRRESITLGLDELIYDPGSALVQFHSASSRTSHNEDPFAALKPLWKQGEPIRIAKQDLEPVVLLRFKKRQVLYLDVQGAHQEIGADLQQTDRQWLAEVIREWQET